MNMRTFYSYVVVGRVGAVFWYISCNECCDSCGCTVAEFYDCRILFF